MSRFDVSTMSSAALALIEQVQINARAALLAELSAKDGVTVLQPIDKRSAQLSVAWGGNLLEWRDADGTRVECLRRHIEPPAWAAREDMRGHWHPAYWIVHLTCVDARGMRWTSCPGRHVADDFGALVCVEGIAP